MSEARTIWRHTRVYGLGVALNKIAAFLLIPFLLHTLTPEQWGAYALILLMTELFAQMVSVISDGMGRTYFDYKEESDQQVVVGTTLVLFTCAAVLIAAIAYPLAIVVNDLLFDHDRYQAALFVANLGVIVDLLYVIECYRLRLRKASLQFVAASLSRSILQLGISILLVIGLDMGVMGVVLGP